MFFVIVQFLFSSVEQNYIFNGNNQLKVFFRRKIWFFHKKTWKLDDSNETLTYLAKNRGFRSRLTIMFNVKVKPNLFSLANQD